MPQIDISNPLPGGMPPGMDINKIPSIHDTGKSPEDVKHDDTRPKKPPCPNCGKYHYPFSP